MTGVVGQQLLPASGRLLAILQRLDALGVHYAYELAYDGLSVRKLRAMLRGESPDRLPTLRLGTHRAGVHLSFDAMPVDRAAPLIEHVLTFWEAITPPAITAGSPVGTLSGQGVSDG